MDRREQIIDALETLRKKEFQEKNVFKARAYGKVVQQLKAHTSPIYTMNDVRSISGIGDKIHAKIQEIMNTGVLKVAEEIKKDSKVKTANVFLQVYGIGPVKAKALIEKEGLRTIEDLRQAVQHRPDLLHEKQRIGLTHYDDLLLRIPRTEVKEHEKILHTKLPKILHMDIVGSYRREMPDSGDIDVLVGYSNEVSEKEARKAFQDFVSKLQGSGYITDTLAIGPKKCMAISRVSGKPARRLDLLLTNAEEYPYALLYFTGSDKYNIAMRKRALELGYTLNEHRMSPIRDDVPSVPFMKEERDIVEFLKMTYVPPKERV